MAGLEGGEGEEEEGEEGEGEEGEGMAIELTEEDMQKVERLEALGFSRETCLEALIACDMNEELAANFMAEASFD
jgi:UV excision repair protein RAD23